jgi:osmoprotectant transport system ATP-binding protein
MISYRNVSKRFGPNAAPAVDSVSFDVAEGETLVLLGSSGSGKSTLLKLTNRLLEPTEGNIALDGEDTAWGDPVNLRRKIGYVFQGIGLFPHYSVRDNVAMVPRLMGEDVTARNQRTNELLDLVGLPPGEYGDRFPDELSGGQQQRVGVARALAADPNYLLMDEPFGALDAITRDALQQELLRLKAQLKKTIIFVTHDIFEALTLGDRIAVMHEGKLEQIGTKEEILAQPATDFVRELFAKPARQLAACGALLKPDA